MARIRMIKPDVRESEKVASWPIEVRYFWVLLWGYVDDHGKGKDNPLLVKSDCFPLDVEITGDVVDGWLWLLAESGVIARYENGGQKYLEVVNWAEHQKPQHPKPDVLPGHAAVGSVRRDRHEVVMKPSGKSREALTPELSRDGSEFELGMSAPASGGDTVRQPDYFSIAYESWPKKVDRKDAAVKWPKAVKEFGRGEAELVEIVKAHGAAYQGNFARQFIPSLLVWLNRARWDNELPTVEAENVIQKPTVSGVVTPTECVRHPYYPAYDCARCAEEMAVAS